jgi:hypothetical protein
MFLLIALFCFDVIGGPLALVLFVLTQIPITFLRRKPKAGGPGPSLLGTGDDEGLPCKQHTKGGFYKRGCQEKTLHLICRGRIFF